MATPDFILELRRHIGTAPLWLSGVTAVVVRERTEGANDGGAHLPHTGAPSGASAQGAAAAPAAGAAVARGAGSAATTDAGLELLLVRRADNGAWAPVTGIIDPGEEPAVAGAREVLEEAGVVAVATRLASVSITDEITYDNGDRSRYLDLTFRCDWVSGDPHPADGENTDARWFAVVDLPSMSPDMTARIRSALPERGEARFVP